MNLALSPQATQKINYTASPTPSIASTTHSVWSVASGVSSQATSVASSTIDNFSAPSTAVIPQLSSQSILGSDFRRAPTPALVRPRPSLTIAEPVPVEQRQHPRRTNRLVESSTQKSVVPAVEGCTVPPPPAAPPVPSLQRQADRKVNFVENLVDSAAQIVETIWTPPKYLASAAPKDAVLPLRTFIQETLRRSRTSYSTLQVALYYLIVIRPHLPGMDCDVTGMDPQDVQLVRAKQCGRRMFLAALILASKYLQDRNYSARAWSKISGLGHAEINLNEMAFLDAVDWKLHISEVVFQKWTDLVLKYTSAPSPSPVSPTRTSPWSEEEERKQEWCDLVLRLSPDLSEVELPAVVPAQVDTDNTSPAHIDIAPAHAPHPPPATLRKTHSMPVHIPSGPPLTLEAQLQNSNAFKALHNLPTTNLPVAVSAPLRHLPASSLSIPAVSSEIGAMAAPKVGNAMVGVAQSAMSSMLVGCSQEAYPGAGPSGRVRPGLSEPSCRRSSLATCISASEASPRPSFKRQDGSEIHKRAIKGSSSGSSLLSNTLEMAVYDPNMVLSTPSSSPLGGSRAPSALSMRRSMVNQTPNQLMPMASPKSTEAAWTLNLLREAPSPATSVGSTTPTSGRKRSCPSVGPSNSSGVTPRLQGLGGFRSPVIGSCSPNLDRGGKRARCAWESFDATKGVAQSVR